MLFVLFFNIFVKIEFLVENSTLVENICCFGAYFERLLLFEVVSLLELIVEPHTRNHSTISINIEPVAIA